MGKTPVHKRPKTGWEFYIPIVLVMVFLLLIFFIWLWYDIKIHQIDNQKAAPIESIK